MTQRIRIGYCGPKAKWERMKWAEFVSYCNERSVDLIWIDLKQPIEKQGHFDLIIHKLTYIMKGYDITCNEELLNLYNYIKANNVILVDDLDQVAVLLDREELTKKLKTITWPKELSISIPNAEMLNNESTIENLNAIGKNLRFPIIAKPKSASSSQGSHTLRLATEIEQLVGVITPSLLQEYINHNGIVYKLYTLGDTLISGIRPSTRNINKGECINIDFFSQPSEEAKSIWTPKRDLSKVEMPIEDFKQISKILRKELKMDLIGFDILIDDDKHYWLVDVNYFPGYKNVDDLWGKFYNFLIGKINK